MAQIKQIVIIVFATLSLSSSMAFAGAFYVNSAGIWALTSAQNVPFQAVYTDNTGLEWGKKLPGTYANGCLDEQGRGDVRLCSPAVTSGKDSDAEQACEDSAIGGRLPTWEEYEGLIRSFDHVETTSGPKLTIKGLQDMQNAFGDMAGQVKVPTNKGLPVVRVDNQFWTSSVNSEQMNRFARYFDGYTGQGYSDYRWDYNTSVRCVGPKTGK